MVGKKSKKRTREQATKGNSGISPPNKRAGTAKTVRRRRNTIQTTISEWVLDEELPMSQYNSAGPHTQAADPHKYTTKPITTDHVLQQYMQLFDFICLLETKCNSIDENELSDYKTFIMPRKSKSHKYGGIHGICILVKNAYASNCSVVT